MRGQDRASWTRAAAVVLAATALGALLPRATGLVDLTYPGIACEIGRDESVEKALEDAAVDYSWDTEPLFENVPAVFTFSVIYGPAVEEDPTVQIACENEARLVVEEEEWDHAGMTSSRQDLDDAEDLTDGSQALTWQWEMTPRSSGTLAFDVVVQPIVIVGGKETMFRRRNEPVRIEVRIHENAQALTEVAEAAEGLAVSIPSMTVGGRTEVGASLPMLGHEDVVSADIDLSPGDDSVAATIRATDAGEDAGSLVRAWTVEPSAPGPVNLVFTTTLRTQAGDVPLEQVVQVSQSVEADASWWDRVKGMVTFAGVALAAVATGLAIWTQVKRRGDSTERRALPGDASGSRKRRALRGRVKGGKKRGRSKKGGGSGAAAN